MDAESIHGAARADRDLLRAFVDRADGDAFAALVSRHGPLVLGVCQRVLADAPEAEDAFQATFLILARKAASVQHPERLGNWLYGVALRCSGQARKAARRVKKQSIPDLPARETADSEWSDVGPVLDAEIGQLPEKLRVAIVLCELQGLDRASAAERLGVPIGTVSSRLSRAKGELRRRLVRRGITLSLAALALILTKAASAAVPPPLIRQTAKAAKRFATGSSKGAPAALATRVMRGPTNRVVWYAAGGGLLIVVLAVGLWLLFGRSRGVDDRKAIQGTWYVVSSAYGGDDARDMFGPTMTFDEKMARFKQSVIEGQYKIDPSRDPKEIDLEISGGEGGGTVVFRGIYELTEGRLLINFGEPDGPRPKALQRDPKQVFIVLLLTRAPPPERRGPGPK